MKIINRRSTFALLAVMLWTMAGSYGSASPFNKLTYFKFSKAVAIPGARLEPGEYAFALADPNGNTNVVAVTNRNHSKVYGIALTRPVYRSLRGGGASTVMLGESREGEPAPVKSWFPESDGTGYEFIYR